jgi:hypothetical protein
LCRTFTGISSFSQEKHRNMEKFPRSKQGLKRRPEGELHPDVNTIGVPVPLAIHWVGEPWSGDGLGI